MAKLSTTVTLKSAWDLAKLNFPVLAILAGIDYLITFVSNEAYSRPYAQSTSDWLYPSFTLIEALLDSVLFFIIVRAALQLVDGKKVEPRDLFKNLQVRQVIIFVVTSFIFGVAAGVGFLLLVIPGLYIVTTYGFYGLAIVDKNEGIGGSLRVSKEVTTGHKMELVPLYLLSFVVSFALGAIHPLLSAASLVFFYLAFAKAYRTLG